jgi:CTP:phosphocholine cytidylyltransferase-like protein
MADQLDKAEQQLLGFKTAQNGETLSDLVCAMGLTKDEFEDLKENYELNYLDEEDFAEIEAYLNV